MKQVNTLKSKIKISDSMKNVAKISVGTMSGQLISFLSLIIFTRLYDKDVLANWATINAVALIVDSFSDLGLTNAIMIEENKDSLLRLYKVISTIGITISLIMAMLLGSYYTISGKDLGVNLFFLIGYIFVAIFTLQQTQICYTLLNRNGKYDVLMKNPLINNGFFGIVGIGLGLLGFKQYGYFMGWIIGQVITILHMKRNLPKSMFTFKKEDFICVFKERKRFVQYQLPTNIISITKNQLPVLLIGAFFGRRILADYSVSMRLLNVPITLLASSMGRVYFKTISEMKRNGKVIGEFTYRNLVKAMKISIVPMIGLITLGDIVVMIMFGHKYVAAGDILRIVAFQNFFTFLMMTLQGLGITLDKQNYNMISCIFQSIGFALGLGIGKYVFNSVYIGIALMSIAFIIINVTYFCMLFKVINISIKKYLRHVILSISAILLISIIVRVLLFLVHLVPTL